MLGVARRVAQNIRDLDRIEFFRRALRRNYVLECGVVLWKF